MMYGTSGMIYGTRVYLEYEVNETRTDLTLERVFIGDDTQNVIDVIAPMFHDACVEFVRCEASIAGQLID